MYGYSSPIGAEGETVSLMDSITMKDMSAEDFKSLGDNVNIHMVGFIAECNTFDDDPQAA